MPEELVQSIDRLVRLVRSKGVGIFFVTQFPADIPDSALAQLGSRISTRCVPTRQTPEDGPASAAAFRENRGVDIRAEITTLAVGEA